MVSQTITERDLRPGNWVDAHFMGQRERAKIKYIAYSEAAEKWAVYFDGKPNEAYSLDCLKPIPITEKVLEAFGFTELHGLHFFKADSTRNISLERPAPDVSKTGWLVWKGKKRLGLMYLALHDLQNLAYSLDKIEVELKHPKNKKEEVVNG